MLSAPQQPRGGGERWHAFEIGHLFSDQGAMDQKLMISFSDTKNLSFWQPCGLLKSTPAFISKKIQQKKMHRRCLAHGPPQSLLEKIGCQFFIWKAWPRIQRQVIQHCSHEHIRTILHETRVPGHAFWHEDKSTAIMSQSYTMQTCVRLDLASTVSLNDLKGYENICCQAEVEAGLQHPLQHAQGANGCTDSLHQGGWLSRDEGSENCQMILWYIKCSVWGFWPKNARFIKICQRTLVSSKCVTIRPLYTY